MCSGFKCNARKWRHDSLVDIEPNNAMVYISKTGPTISFKYFSWEPDRLKILQIERTEKWCHEQKLFSILMGWTLPSTGMWRGEVFAISDCLVQYANRALCIVFISQESIIRCRREGLCWPAVCPQQNVDVSCHADPEVPCTANSWRESAISGSKRLHPRPDTGSWLV